MRTICGLPSTIVAMVIVASASGTFAQETKQLPLPQVTVTAPAAPVEPSYLRNPWQSYQRNPYAGRYRVEEDKFTEVSCNVTRIATSAGGKCLQGYRLTPGNSLTRDGALNCDMALDVVTYNVGSLSIEADTLIFDPYKVVATGMPDQWCYVRGYPRYGQEDFQDMNQVTRRGTNWRNLMSNAEDKTIEFSNGPHSCVAVRKAGPPWRGGYVYTMHVSICRTDTAALRAEDISYTLGQLQVRQYDPVGSLREAGK